MHDLEDTEDNRSLWWTQTKSLDQRLSKFLSNLEDLWFGPWKFLLLGEFSGCKQQEAVLWKLVHNLKLLLGNECFLGYCNQERLGALSDTCHEVQSLSKRAFKLTLEALHEVDEGECLNREPVILVLDFDVQMLPWESSPIVRNQEVYRMPSIGSIFAILAVNSRSMMRRMLGKAVIAPTIEELAVALRSHDLFIYFGHGSELQFIAEQEIQKLQNCAATLLMGCSSGSLSLNSSYTPQGAPLCYLLAGSPVIVANLWEVTDEDID